MPAEPATHAGIPAAVRDRADRFIGRSTTLKRIARWLDAGPVEPYLCLTGEPGTGKSALMAWLAGFGPPPTDPEEAAIRMRITTAIDAVHFSVATRSGADASLDPWVFVRGLARQLAARFPAYGMALANLLPGVQVTMSAGSVGTQIGPQFGTINLGDAASLFHTVCQPLHQLRDNGSVPEVIVLVDALDEADLWTPAPTIVDLVVSGAGQGAPPNLRFLVASRPDPDVIDRFPPGSTWDLVDDSVADGGDVLAYVQARIAERAPSASARLAGRIAGASGGNFLYAEQALDYWLPRLEELGSVEDLELPPGLDAIYALFLQREYAAENGKGKWRERLRPLLGTVGVAQERLVAPALRWLLEVEDDRLQDALRSCEQYLDGKRPNGPFGIYHQSFRDFLFDPRRNPQFPVSARDAHARIGRRYLDRYGGDWPSVHDDYGLRHTATHLAEAAASSQQPDRHDLAAALGAMVLDPSFQRAHEDRLDEPAALIRDAETAVAALAGDDSPAAVVQAIECALGLVALRREHLQPAKLFELAARGELAAARRRLDSFPIEDLLRDAALLACAWEAAAVNPAGARDVLDSVRPGVKHTPVLELLAARLAARLGLEPPPPVDPGPPPPEYVARAIVDRLGGTDLQSSPSVLAEDFVSGEQILAGIDLARGGEGAGAPDYAVVLAADREGPLLVAFAAAVPDPGDRLMREYISLHASNSYVHYRNRSLVALLWAALHHPSAEWVRSLLPQLISGALAGNTLDFEECLPLAALSVRAAGDPAAASHLDAERARAVEVAGALKSNTDAEGDSWSANKRRLGALAEALTLALDRSEEAERLLDQAASLPFGFAGFQAPGCLTLAESMLICRPGDAARSAAQVRRARQAAHNVQDPLLCARATSRVRFAEREWWPLRGPLPEIAWAFVARPNAPGFASLHVVGEQYEDRNVGEASVPLPPATRDARTVVGIAQAYERPAAEVARLNPDLDPGAALPDGSIVRVPDPDVIPLFAARLSAEVLVDPGLSPRERVRLVQAMIPPAASNATALDTVLGRLVLAARMDLAGKLDPIDTALTRFRPAGSPFDQAPNRLLPS